MSRILYFAYGSNMLTERLCAAGRCPSAKHICTAEAEGWSLSFSKQSIDGSGKATLERVPGASARGVLFEVDFDDIDALNRAEGRAYAVDDLFEVTAAGERVTCRAYRAKENARGLQPYDWYLALVVAGARQNGLPGAYVEALGQVPCAVDPDPVRPSRLEALAALESAGMGSIEDILKLSCKAG